MQAHCHFKYPVQAQCHQFDGFLVPMHNYSMHCEVVAIVIHLHPFHEGQWPR